MTRSEQTLMLMTWLVPYHGLSPEDAQAVAESVLDGRYNGDLAEAVPAEVLHALHEEYFRLSMEDGMSPENSPSWEDYGFVRPPVLDELGRNASLSDGTSIISSNLALFLSNIEATNPEDPYGDQFIGVGADGSLSLASGGIIPPLTNELRKRIWVAVFCSPTDTTQEDIDAMVENPPSLPNEPTVIQQRAIDAYDAVFQSALEMSSYINEQVVSQEGHTH